MSGGKGVPASSFLSFYFKIEGLQPNYAVQPNRALHNPQGYWAPPDIQNAYTSTTTHWFRWYGGNVASVQSLPNPLQQYREATIFSQQDDTDHLLAVEYNVKLQNVRHASAGWNTLSFEHVRLDPGNTYSKVKLFGDEKKLAAPGSPHWMPQLLPSEYNYRRTGPHDDPIPSDTRSAGLIGNLAILLALAAFSAPRNRLSTVLTSCIGLQIWRPHHLPTGRTPERGMIVTIYLDPANPTYSTVLYLDKLEEGHCGPFYGP